MADANEQDYFASLCVTDAATKRWQGTSTGIVNSRPSLCDSAKAEPPTPVLLLFSHTQKKSFDKTFSVEVLFLIVCEVGQQVRLSAATNTPIRDNDVLLLLTYTQTKTIRQNIFC